MSFRWASFLELASELRERDSDAARRSAISRAYYAAFNVAKSYINAQNPLEYIPPDGRAHRQVWAYLQQVGRSREEIDCGIKGERALGMRNRADYRPSMKKLADAVDTSLGWSQRVIKALDDF